MVFNEYVRTLRDERKDLVDALVKSTLTHRSVVYRWLNGQVTPPPLKQKVIAQTIGIPVEELFPQNDNKC